MSEKTLAKAQVRKIVKLIQFETEKPARDAGAFFNELVKEYPALKHPRQRERVVDKADPAFKMRVLASKLLENVK